MLDIEIVEESKITLSADRVKDFLLLIYNKTPYTLEFSELTPVRTLGDYNFKDKHIRIFHKNLYDNNELMKTAIHELAHHIDFTKHGRREKPHTGSFKPILEYAEKLAAEKGILDNSNDSQLDNVFNKAMEFGKAILEYGENPKNQHGMDEILKILKNPSKRSVQHYATLYHNLKNK